MDIELGEKEDTHFSPLSHSSDEELRATDEVEIEVEDTLPPPQEPQPLRGELDINLEIPRIFAEAKAREHDRIADETTNSKKKGFRRRKKEKKPDEMEVPQMDDHQLDLESLVRKYGTTIDFSSPQFSRGLNHSEAAQLLQQNGPNRLSPSKVVPAWVKFLKQFLGFFPLLLEAGGILCIIAYAIDSSTNDNLYLGVILWIVVIATAVFSFAQEAKSASVMEGFSKMQAQECKVVREGQLMHIEASELVVGDVVNVTGGDRVPADLRIIWAQNFKVDNSSLTGESEPQSRSENCTNANPLETSNLAFFTTLATEGTAVGIVVRTGDNTIMGRIAGLTVSTKSEDTPLHKEINRFIKIISFVAISLGIIFLSVGFGIKLNWVSNIVFAIGIIVANVPEGLLPTVTVGLTLTAKKMAKRNVLVKNLEAVETLGSCSTICSDKTGTLTQNRMTVVHVFYDNTIWTCDSIPNAGVFNPEAPSFQALHHIASLCNRAVFDIDPANIALPVLQRKTIGDASESALIKFCDPLRNIMEHRSEFPKIFEIPFSSVNKWQLSVHAVTEGMGKIDQPRSLLLIKGAPERIIAMCDHILINGETRPLGDEDISVFNRSYELLASSGERVLGFAQLWLDVDKFPTTYKFDTEDLGFLRGGGLTFVGLTGLIDPPKENVPAAVAMCKRAGVRVVMVTGDHPLTAQAIAKQVGIIEGQTAEDIAAQNGVEVSTIDPGLVDAVVIKGSDIDGLTDDDWARILSKRQIVFARTSPEQKLQIVERFQNNGEIVAVTGDGVNDSPALKRADLGCAMGISGSDVSKEAADIVLLDDNFATIVNGIEEGRIIFENLKKSICYTLSSNSAELLPFLAFIILQLPLALSAVLILCIDLGTDMVPAISLAYERPESDIMLRKPRDPKKDRLVTVKLAAFSYIWLGMIQAIAGFINYFIVLGEYNLPPPDVVNIAFTYFRTDAPVYMSYTASDQLRIMSEAQTAFFVAVVITRIGVLLSCKTRKLSLLTQGMSNMQLNFGILVELGLALILCYVPGVQSVFSTHPLGYKSWLVPLPFFAFIVSADELRKFIVRKSPRGWFAKHFAW